jgi:hypothetical protein
MTSCKAQTDPGMCAERVIFLLFSGNLVVTALCTERLVEGTCNYLQI